MNFIIIFIIYLFIFGCAGSLFLHRFLSSCNAQISHCVGFPCCRVQALRHAGFSSHGSQALEHRFSSCRAQSLSCSLARGIFPDQRSNPFPALAGGLLTPGLPGKPQVAFLRRLSPRCAQRGDGTHSVIHCEVPVMISYLYLPWNKDQRCAPLVPQTGVLPLQALWTSYT